MSEAVEFMFQASMVSFLVAFCLIVFVFIFTIAFGVSVFFVGVVSDLLREIKRWFGSK